jgi:transcriptional regulator with XRE-family HTH domain
MAEHDKRNLAAWRKARDMTQMELAVAAGLTLGTVQNLEGARQLPSMVTANRIAGALGVAVDDPSKRAALASYCVAGRTSAVSEQAYCRRVVPRERASSPDVPASGHFPGHVSASMRVRPERCGGNERWSLLTWRPSPRGASGS